MKRIFLLLPILVLSSCGKVEKCEPGHYRNVNLNTAAISCDYGENKTFVIESEDDIYVSAVKLYDDSGNDCVMRNSDETFSMVPDTAISDQSGSPIPYTVSGNGYSITQMNNHEVAITIKSEMNYRRIWVFVDAKNAFLLTTPITFIRPGDPDYEYFFGNDSRL